MTQPAPPPVDPGNHLLSEQAAVMTASLVQTSVGQRLAYTIRTPSVTLTVFLGKDDALAWGGQLRNIAKQMSGSGLIVAAPGGNGHAVGQNLS